MNSDLSFPIRILEKEGQYICYIKELSLLESGSDLLQIYENINTKKNAIIKDFSNYGLESLLRKKPVESAKKKKLPLSNLFFIAVLILVPMLSILRPLASILNQSSKLLKVKPVDFVISFEERLKNMPLEKKEKFTKAIHAIMKDYHQVVHASKETQNNQAN